MLRGIKNKERTKEVESKKALLITTVSGFVPQFEMNNVHILQELGYEVHYASNFHHPHYGFDNQRLKGSGICCHQVGFVRSPFRIRKNIQAYQELKAILFQQQFDLIHCHTPMGGVLGRLAAKSWRRKEPKGKLKVYYTAHGFHFFRGAPLFHWLFYYPVEWWLARETDVLLTLNQEDYQRAKRFRLRKVDGKRGRVERIFGVGIDWKNYENLTKDREKIRKQLKIASDCKVFLSVGELTKRKNHRVVIEAIALLKKEGKAEKVRYFICGEGPERKKLMDLIQRKRLTKIVQLLGYQTEVKNWLAIADCFVFPSKQEGLPVALLEAKATGLPCICSNIRGCRELVEKEELVSRNRKEEYLKKIKEQIAQVPIEKMEREEKRRDYSKEQVMSQMRRIYRT